MTYHDQVHRHVEATRRRMDLLLDGSAAGKDGDAARRVAEELYAAIEELQVSEEELRLQNESLAAAELLLQEERARYAELFHLAPDPYLVTTLDGAVREANHAAAELLGVAPGRLRAKPLAVFVVPGGRREFWLRLTQVAEEGRADDWELTLAPRGREPVTVSCSVARSESPSAGEARLRWLLRDVTERRRAAERERRLAAESAARAEAEAAHERLSAVLEGTTDAFFSVDRAWRLTYVNRRAEALVRRSRADLLRHLLWDCFPAAAASEARAALEHAMASGEAVEVEASPVPGRWVEIHGHPSPQGLSIYFRDVTARRAGEERDRLLTRAGAVLAGSLDPEILPREVAALATETLADWCVVHVETEHGLRAAGIAHADPARVKRLRDLLRAYAAPETHPLTVALRTGQPQLVPVFGEGVLEGLIPDPEMLQAVREMGIASVIVVPMRARGRTVGSISLVRGHGAAYGEDELEVAVELARRAALALDNAALYEQARAATRSREEVLAVVSHDLRNPLNAVLLAAVILDEYTDPERWNERERLQLRTIRHSAEQMTTLIHDLVEVVALEAGTRVLHLEKVDAGALLRSAAEMYAGLAAEQEVALWVDSPPEVPDVRADRARLLQVLSNLVGNALKFTPSHGSVRVGAEAAGETVRFWVSDTGSGIDPEHLPHLFERFWQARRGDRQGLGLGLSIAKAIVDAHGGRIWAESTPGAGSTFSFTLPIGATDG
ncbi:MAG TPA: ATP-binding protein [Longimicrobium sp.]|jgi:PAS domain S-box-containing protein|nr:ATP-binding protein [Longimicrobium sp.]